MAKKHPLDGYDYTADVPLGTPLIVVDYAGRVWRLAKRGVRYHSDVSTRLHGAKPARAPKEFAASERLRTLISEIVRGGMSGAELPAVTATWTDQEPGSYASRPYLEIRGDVIRAIIPVYDDAPRVGVRCAKPAQLRRVLADMAIAPKGVHLPRVHIHERTVRVPVDDPRHAEAAAIPGARPMYDGGPIEVPITAWRAHLAVSP